MTSELTEGEILLGQALLATALGSNPTRVQRKVANLVYRKAISPGGRPADDSPVGTPGGKQNWVDKVGGLPKYIRMVAHALMRDHGFTESRAIATAVTRMKVWAVTATDPKVKAAAIAALAEFEAKRGAARASKRAGLLEEKRDRVVRSVEGERRFGKPIGSIIGGYRFMNDAQMGQQFGDRKRRYTYAPGEHASLHESGDIVLDSGGVDDYEHDVYAHMNPDQGDELVHALTTAINGAANWRPETAEEGSINDETGLVDEMELSNGTRVGYDAVGDVRLVFPTQDDPTPEHRQRDGDEHLLSNEEARSLTSALYSLVYEARNEKPPGDEIDEDPNAGYDLEHDPNTGQAYIVIQNAAQAAKFGQPIGTSVWAPNEEKRAFGADDRRQAASAGHALPNGSYPIENVGDLHNAIRLAQSGHGDVAAATALIKRRARELGCEDALPPEWKSFLFPKGFPTGAESSLRWETKTIRYLGQSFEAKVRYVRTPAGADFYGIPIGMPITADVLNRVRGVPMGKPRPAPGKGKPDLPTVPEADDHVSAAPFQHGMMDPTHKLPSGYTVGQVDEALDDLNGKGWDPIRHTLTTDFEDPYWEDTIKAIDGGMAPSERPTVSYQTVSDQHDVFGPSWSETTSMEGLTFQNPIYAPVSTQYQASAGGKVVMRLHAPAGTKMIGMDESTLLLDRGGQYRVTKDYGYVGGVRQLDLEVIPEHEHLKPNGLGVLGGKRSTPLPKPRKTAKAAPVPDVTKKPKAPVKKTPTAPKKAVKPAHPLDNPGLGTDRMSQDIMEAIGKHGDSPEDVISMLRDDDGIDPDVARAYVEEVVALMKHRGTYPVPKKAGKPTAKPIQDIGTGKPISREDAWREMHGDKPMPGAKKTKAPTTLRGKTRTPDVKPGDRIMVEKDSEGQLVPEMVRGASGSFPVTVVAHNKDGSLKVSDNDGKVLDTVPDAKNGTFYRYQTPAEARREAPKPATVKAAKAVGMEIAPDAKQSDIEQAIKWDADPASRPDMKTPKKFPDFDESQAQTYQTKPEARTAHIMVQPAGKETVLDVPQWGAGQQQTMYGTYARIGEQDDSGNTYGSAYAEFLDMYHRVPGSTDKWVKDAPVSAYMYHGEPKEIRTVLASGQVEVGKDGKPKLVHEGEWLVRQKNGEVQIVSDEKFRRLQIVPTEGGDPTRTAHVKESVKSRTEKATGYPDRAPVPDDKADPHTPFPGYDPPSYTAPAVIANDTTKRPKGYHGPKFWADPEDPHDVDRKFTSSTGPIEVDDKGRPINPYTRTGIQDRGLLGKWGANQAGDPIITRVNPETGALEMISIQRGSNAGGGVGQWAIPGGMQDEGEDVATTVSRELHEETGAEVDMHGGRTVYKGYVDDPRNTDNAWMETTAIHRHLTAAEAAKVKLSGQMSEQEISKKQWAPITPEFLDHLYASHKTFVTSALQQMLDDKDSGLSDEQRASLRDTLAGKAPKAPKASELRVKPAAERGKKGDGFYTNPDGSHGPYGKYGASGILLRHVGPDGVPRYLMAKRSEDVDKGGTWAFPGGAKDEHETDVEGATREMTEELGMDPAALRAGKIEGQHTTRTPGGWHYTSVAVTVPTRFDPKLDPDKHWETSETRWMTADEIAKLDQDGKLHPALAGGKLHSNVLSLFGDAPKPAAKKAEPEPPAAAHMGTYTPPASVSKEDQRRAEKLIRTEYHVFATVQPRTSRVASVGNIPQIDAEWLERLHDREPAFVNYLAQKVLIERRLDEQAKKAGMTPAAYRRQEAERFKEVLKDKPIVTRVPDEAALRSILDSGQFRTSHSRGVKRAPGLTTSPGRKLGEEIHGVPTSTPDAQRPIYGYVAIHGVEPAGSAGRKIPGIAQREGQTDVLSSYGQIQVVLKPHVRERTTATAGDSLDEIGFVRPSPVDNPSADSLGLASIDDMDDPDWTRRRYVEAQVNGGVSADDIQEVVFASKPDPATAAKLKDKGIKWRVLAS